MKDTSLKGIPDYSMDCEREVPHVDPADDESFRV